MSKIERKITHNKHGEERTCSRCLGKPTVIRVKSEYLCKNCKAKRAERQQKERQRSRNYCKCGTEIGKSATTCDACFSSEQRVSSLDECENMEDLKEWIKDNFL